MTKRLLLCFSIVVFSTLSSFAQSPQLAKSSYDAYVRALNSGNKLDTYNSIYEAHKQNLSLLKSAAKGSADYMIAKQNLVNLWPMLENAAVFFSSNGRQTNSILLAAAYLEMPQLEDFRGMNFNYSENRAQLAYFVAAHYFNSKDYAKAIPFLDQYLRTGEEKNRKNVFKCFMIACKEEKQAQTGLNVADEAVRCYPNDFDILSAAINFSQEVNDMQALKNYLDRALAIRPNDTQLLNMQGKMYEDTRDFANALVVYRRLLQTNPNVLEINKHVALNCYNLGVLCANRAITESDAKAKKNLQKQAAEHFAEAVPVLKKITTSDPSSLKYTSALAVAYAQLGQSANLTTTNQKLASMGAGRISADYIPQMMTYNSNSVGGDVAANNNSSSFIQPSNQPQNQSATSGEIPTFSEFAKDMIEAEINKWQVKDPYETVNEYKARVTEQTRNAKVAELKKQAEADYIARYGGELKPANFTLKPYDAENGVFLVESALGQIVVPVPRDNNEAMLFEKSWNGVSLERPQYCIANDHLALAAVTFVTPTGKRYQFKNDQTLSYTETQVDVHFNDIDYSNLAMNSGGPASNVTVKKQTVSAGQSDVDMNIPQGAKGDENTFVLIIANEEYKSVAKVPFAANDGKTFAEYCTKTLGIPASNIRITTNATFMEMREKMRWIVNTLSKYDGDGRAIVYYAGHGIPDEASRSAYLLPVDGNGTDVSTGFSLADFYSSLSSAPSKGVTVLLDACFSGATREGGMMASARGVAIKAKKETPKGNLIVFSAAQGDETAWPYEEKGHGLFTYYLLKKLQDSQGKATLGEIADYVTREVDRKSTAINSKSQTPTVIAPIEMGDSWKKRTLK